MGDREMLIPADVSFVAKVDVQGYEPEPPVKAPPPPDPRVLSLLPRQTKAALEASIRGTKLQPGRRLLDVVQVPALWQQVLVGKSGKTNSSEPTKGNPFLYRLFAAMKYRIEEYIWFANKFGPLIGRGRRGLAEMNPSFAEWAVFHSNVKLLCDEPIDDEPSFVKRLRKANSLAAQFERDQSGRITGAREVNIDPTRKLIETIEDSILGMKATPTLHPKGYVILSARMKSLQSAIALQALNSQMPRGLRPGRKWKQCQYGPCGEYFEVGTGTGRRKTAMYCKPKCNNAVKSERKSRAALDAQR